MKTKPAPEAVAPSVARQAPWLELMLFFIREAWLLDERRFKEWLELFTHDVPYFMPRRKYVPRRESHRELTPLGDLASSLRRTSAILRCGSPGSTPGWPVRRTPVAHPPPDRQSRGSIAGERRVAGQVCVSGVPLAPGDGRLRKSITTAGNAPNPTLPGRGCNGEVGGCGSLPVCPSLRCPCLRAVLAACSHDT